MLRCLFILIYMTQKNQDLRYIQLDLIQYLILIFNKIDFMNHFNSLNFEPLNENGENEAFEPSVRIRSPKRKKTEAFAFKTSLISMTSKIFESMGQPLCGNQTSCETIL